MKMIDLTNRLTFGEKLSRNQCYQLKKWDYQNQAVNISLVGTNNEDIFFQYLVNKPVFYRLQAEKCNNGHINIFLNSCKKNYPEFNDMLFKKIEIIDALKKYSVVKTVWIMSGKYPNQICYKNVMT